MTNLLEEKENLELELEACNACIEQQKEVIKEIKSKIRKLSKIQKEIDEMF